MGMDTVSQLGCASTAGDEGRSLNSPDVFRGGRLRVASRNLVVGTWNVEGLTDAKIVELQLYMQKLGIGILCLQETHRTESTHEVTDDAFLLILSGAAAVCRRYVVSFCQQSSRMTSLKIRVSGGRATICSIYAPHSGRPRDDRQAFFQQVAHWLLSRSCHGPLLVFGDCNARLHAKLDSDPYFIGPHMFGDGRANFDTDSNRSLLLELCECCRLIVGNTFFPQPANKQVTYYNIGAQPSSEIIPANFGQLDFLLVQHDWLACVSQLYSCMDVPLASHHFLVIAELTIQVPKRNTRNHSDSYSCNQPSSFTE